MHIELALLKSSFSVGSSSTVHFSYEFLKVVRRYGIGTSW